MQFKMYSNNSNSGTQTVSVVLAENVNIGIIDVEQCATKGRCSF